jgi:hypothetical protein
MGQDPILVELSDCRQVAGIADSQEFAEEWQEASVWNA